MIKNNFKIILLTTLGVAVFYWIYLGLQKNYEAECALKSIAIEDCSLSHKLVSDFAKVNLGYVVLAILIFLLSNVIRAKRWEMMIEPLGVKPLFRNTLGTILISYLVNLALVRGGELVRASAFAKHENISTETAFGTIVTDRIIDFFCFAFMCLLALIFGYDKIMIYFEQNLDLSSKYSALQKNTTLIIILLLGTLVAAAMLYRWRHAVSDSKLGAKVKNMLYGMRQGLLSVLKLRQPSLFITISIAVWLCYFLMAYVLFKAYEGTSHLGMATALVVSFFGSLGVIFPSPGGMGSYHFLVMESLSMYAIAKSDGFVYANLVFFSIQVFANLLFGLLGVLMLKSNKS